MAVTLSASEGVVFVGVGSFNDEGADVEGEASGVEGEPSGIEGEAACIEGEAVCIEGEAPLLEVDGVDRSSLDVN